MVGLVNLALKGRGDGLDIIKERVRVSARARVRFQDRAIEVKYKATADYCG